MSLTVPGCLVQLSERSIRQVGQRELPPWGSIFWLSAASATRLNGIDAWVSQQGQKMGNINAQSQLHSHL